jgi:hypothetical protein
MICIDGYSVCMYVCMYVFAETLVSILWRNANLKKDLPKDADGE